MGRFVEEDGVSLVRVTGGACVCVCGGKEVGIR